MEPGDEILEKVRTALSSEAAVGLAGHPVSLAFSDGDLTMEGEVASVTAKKLALERNESHLNGSAVSPWLWLPCGSVSV